MSDSQTPPSTYELGRTPPRPFANDYRTRGTDAFTGPAQLYRLVGELILVVDGLPEPLNQLGRWLHAEHDADRVRSDDPADPGPAVTQATTQMSDAGDAARDLAHKLDRAQQHLAHLGTQPATRLDPPADLPACSTRPQVVPRPRQHGGPFTLASDSRDR